MSDSTVPTRIARFSYVVIQYSGYEGHGAPLLAFDNLEDAVSFASAMSAVNLGHSVRVYAVPIWPAEIKPFPEPVWGGEK